MPKPDDGQRLTAVSFGKDGREVGRFDFPLRSCIWCMVGAYDMPMDSDTPQEVKHFDIKKGLFIFSACEQYLTIDLCPHFARVQAALLAGRTVKLGPYRY